MVHQPVMLAEVLAMLSPKKGGVLGDLTAGAGGHLRAMWRELSPKKLFAVDQDSQNIAGLSAFGHEAPGLSLFEGNFVDFLEAQPGGSFDGLLMDLGYHSGQLERVPGLSYDRPGHLDMRLSQSASATAADLLWTATEAELAWWLAEYGEEPQARRLAGYVKRHLPGSREELTTGWLTGLIRRFDPNPPRAQAKIRRVFQALRLAVNQELENLRLALPLAVDRLRAGGRLVVLTFHSLEDRMVKQALRAFAQQGLGVVLTRKAMKPTEEETTANSRAKSALLRAFEKSVLSPTPPPTEETQP